MSKNANREALVDGDNWRMARGTISSVCHDLNNPLSVIAGNAQLLSQLAASMDLGEDFRDSLRDIEQAVELVSAQLERLKKLNERLSEGPGR